MHSDPDTSAMNVIAVDTVSMIELRLLHIPRFHGPQDPP